MQETESENSFTAYEIDLDYEFDAARFFDFSREESPLEARQAEVWFDSAGSYPPSPFVSRCYNLVEQEISEMGMHYEDEGKNKRSSTVDIGSQQKFQNPPHELPSGLNFYNHMVNNISSENQTKSSTKSSFPRSSTLMKPTASHLAKQNCPFQAGYSRSHASILNRTFKNLAHACVIENQAAKRQKLEGGLLRKVVDTVHLQQTSLAHKLPKREGFLTRDMADTKPRITIPRDPDLETANRAQRTRVKCCKDENLTSTVRRFKALPLNRKILEAPSLIPKRSTPRIPDFQEFHLKTSERAMQYSSAVLKSKVPWNNPNKDLHKHITSLTSECGNREPGRTNLINNPSRPDSCQFSCSFKALPLNRKILASKGDIGVFRNSKKETTVPMEFNFQTEKRFHINPPIDLFNKLSLASETEQPANNPVGSKENIWGCFHQGNEINQPAKLKLPLRQGKQQLNC